MKSFWSSEPWLASALLRYLDVERTKRGSRASLLRLLAQNGPGLTKRHDVPARLGMLLQSPSVERREQVEAFPSLCTAWLLSSFQI
jgi:hypothetical protein